MDSSKRPLPDPSPARLFAAANTLIPKPSQPPESLSHGMEKLIAQHARRALSLIEIRY